MSDPTLLLTSVLAIRNLYHIVSQRGSERRDSRQQLDICVQYGFYRELTPESLVPTSSIASSWFRRSDSIAP